MQLQFEYQEADVADEESAILAVIRPVLSGVLNTLNQEVAKELGGINNIKMRMLARNYRPGDGDYGICFEYAVHDALEQGQESVIERVEDALKLCNIKGSTPRSILFGMEKKGSEQLIDTAVDLLTADSVAMSGYQGRPVKLRKHLRLIAAAFRRKNARTRLPASIGDMWKADLFLGEATPDRWVGTSVKSRAKQLQGARGLRVGIVPSEDGTSDKVYLDDRRRLVVCPLPYDGDFVEVFSQAWQVIKAIFYSDMKMPSTSLLARSAERRVARMLIDRKDEKVVDVIEALGVFAQPGLLRSGERAADVSYRNSDDPAEVTSIVSPIAQSSS